MFEFLKDRRELVMFICVWIAFACLLAVKIKFDVPIALKGPDWIWLISFFQAKAFEDIAGDLLTGLIAAYFFYVLIDLIPRKKREKSALRTLNLIVAAVVDAFENRRLYGHEELISLNDVALLEKPTVKRLKKRIKTNARKTPFPLDDYLKLKCALGCVDSRMQDFRAALPLAVTLSPEHVLQWLQLTDRARLLHEEFDKQPVGLDGCFEVQHAFGFPAHGMDENSQEYTDYAHAMRMYAMTLAQRMIQFLMEVDAWMALPGVPEKESEPDTSVTQSETASAA